MAEFQDKKRIRFWQKTGKALDEKLAIITELEAETRRLRQELDARKLIRRRAVKVEANSQDPNVVTDLDSRGLGLCFYTSFI